MKIFSRMTAVILALAVLCAGGGWTASAWDAVYDKIEEHHAEATFSNGVLEVEVQTTWDPLSDDAGGVIVPVGLSYAMEDSVYMMVDIASDIPFRMELIDDLNGIRIPIVDTYYKFFTDSYIMPEDGFLPAGEYQVALSLDEFYWGWDIFHDTNTQVARLTSVKLQGKMPGKITLRRLGWLPERETLKDDDGHVLFTPAEPGPNDPSDSEKDPSYREPVDLLVAERVRPTDAAGTGSELTFSGGVLDVKVKKVFDEDSDTAYGAAVLTDVTYAVADEMYLMMDIESEIPYRVRVLDTENNYLVISVGETYGSLLEDLFESPNGEWIPAKRVQAAVPLSEYYRAHAEELGEILFAQVAGVYVEGLEKGNIRVHDLTLMARRDADTDAQGNVIYTCRKAPPAPFVQVQDASERERFSYQLINGQAIISGYIPPEIETRDAKIPLYGSDDSTPYYTVKVPSVIDGYPVAGIGANVFEDCTALLVVSLPEQIIRIGTQAFSGCRNLQGIFLPTGLQVIDDQVFAGCESLLRATVPASVTSLGEKVFQKCTSLEKVWVGGGVKAVDRAFFDGCEALKTVVFEDGIETLPKGLFADCPILESLTIPPSVDKLDALGCETMTQNGVWGEEVVPNSRLTVYGKVGSDAQRYAQQYRLAFRPIENAQDSFAMIQEAEELYIALCGEEPLTPAQQATLDFNYDGTVDIEDVLCLYLLASGYTYQ